MARSPRYPDPTSVTLLERLAKRDPEALDRVARLYREPLCASLAREFGLSGTDAEEVIQETFMLFVQDPDRLARFVPGSGAKFRSYLFAFAKNVARNHGRKRKPLPLPDDYDDAVFTDELRLYQARGTVIWLKELAERTTRSTQSASAQALLLFYACGRNYAEVGERLKIPVAKVKYLLEAGRKLARERAKTCAMELALSTADFNALYADFLKRLDPLLEVASA